MEAYVKHRKSLISKDRKGKDSLPKPPSFWGPVLPSPPSVTLSVSDVDNRVSSQLTEISASSNRKIEAFQAFFISSFSSMQNLDPVSMSARLSHNHSFAAPSEVTVPSPSHGPEASCQNPESTVGFNREFQADVERMPSGFRTPFPVAQGEFPDRVSSVESAAVQAPPDIPADPVQPAEVRAHSHVHFALPSDASLSALEQAEVDDDNVDTVAYTPLVVDKTLVYLANFIHECYPESYPLSAPQFAPQCGFESLFAVSDPPESTRPRFRLYLLVADIVQNTHDRAANLVKGTKPLSSILPKKRRLQSVADDPEFTTVVLNSDFSCLAENKTISNKCLGTVSFFELECVEGCAKALLETNFSL